MKESPLRDELRDHRQDVTARLIRIEDKLDGHDHGKYVSWVALAPVLVALALGVLQVF